MSLVLGMLKSRSWPSGVSTWPQPINWWVIFGCYRGLASDRCFWQAACSNPETLFDYQSQYDVGSLLWEDDLTGGASVAHDAPGSAVNLTVTTASGDKVTRQTRQYHRYQPGKSQLVLITFVMAAGQANTEQRVGYFDDDNGVFIKEEAGAVSVVIRSKESGSVVDTEIAQASWSEDTLDGTGPSGVVLDLTKAQIFVVDLEWLGVGRVRVGFDVGGSLYYVHEFVHANSITSVYMTTANLPLRYEIENTGAAAAGLTLKAICGSVVSEGGFETSRGLPFCVTTGITPTSVTTEVPILSIRPKATFNSIVNRGTVLPGRATGYSETKGARFNVVYDGALTGASFASVDDDSIVESDTTATAITGGIVIDSFYVPASNQGGSSSGGLGILSRLPLSLDIAGANPKTLTITATRIGSTSTADVLGIFFWQELR